MCENDQAFNLIHIKTEMNLSEHKLEIQKETRDPSSAVACLQLILQLLRPDHWCQTPDLVSLQGERRLAVQGKVVVRVS